MAISNMNHTFISQVPTKMNEPFEAACFSELAVTQDDFTPLNSQGAVRHDHKPVIISGKYVNASWPAPSLCTMFTKISTMYSGAEGGSFFFFYDTRILNSSVTEHEGKDATRTTELAHAAFEITRALRQPTADIISI